MELLAGGVTAYPSKRTLKFVMAFWNLWRSRNVGKTSISRKSEE